MTSAAPSLGTDKLVIGALSAVIFVAAALNHHLVNAAVGAAAFWFGAERLVAWAIAYKQQLGADVAAGEVDPELAPVLAKLEATRVTIAAQIDARVRTRVPLGLAGGVLIWAWTQFSRDPAGLLPLAAFAAGGALVGWMWASASLAEKYRDMYKAEVLPRLAAGFGGLAYRRADGVDAEMLRQQRLFRRFNRVTAEDEIVGTFRGVPVSIVELALEQKNDKTTDTVFDGLLIRVTLPRMLSGTTAIIADHGMLGNLTDLLGGPDCERIRLEDPAFESSYQVYGTDQIGARALLTPAFMERFLALGGRTGFQRPLALAQDNHLTVTLPKQGSDNLFEPPDYRRPANSQAALAKLHDDLAAVLQLVEAVLDLDQSVRGRAAER